MKKVLIITYDMLPHSNSWGGCQRMYFLANKLVEKGYCLTVVALRNAPYEDFGKKYLNNTIFPNVNKPYSRIDNENQRVSKRKKNSNVFINALKKIAFKLDQLFFNEIKRGDGILTYIDFYKAKSTLKKILSCNDFDVVICSGPPFNVFRCIPLVRKYNPFSKIIMDYRDPWNSWHDGNILTARRERHYQYIADKIVCTNSALCEDMAKRFNIDLNKYSVIANGFIGDFKQCSKRNPSKCYFVYAGSISFTQKKDGYRDVTQFIDALLSLKERGVDNLKFLFVGASDNDFAYINSFKSRLGDMIEILPPVSVDEANIYIRDSDVCLLLHTSNDNSGKFLISGKLYDYIREKKFILSIGDNNTQHARIVNELGIGFNTINESEQIASSILKCFDMWRNGTLLSVYNNLDTSIFSRDNQIQRYIQIIEHL